MDFLPDTNVLSIWLIQYGSFVLFVLLTLGIIAFPVPEETLMVLAGILMHHGKLNIIPTIIATCAGSICGITISYIVGRTAGSYILKKYGKWIGITEKHLQKAHYWFERFGKWALLIGYFIPGVRHFTGFSAGLTKLEYNQFALFAYTGAVIWISIFLSIGYFFGAYWFAMFKHIIINPELIGFIILLLCAFFFLFFIIKRRS